jgi:hypothetical protein
LSSPVVIGLANPDCQAEAHRGTSWPEWQFVVIGFCNRHYAMFSYAEVVSKLEPIGGILDEFESLLHGTLHRDNQFGALA